MKAIIVIMTALLVTSVWAEQKDEKPADNVAKDGFPTGQGTPEGAACDLTRAFIDARCLSMEENYEEAGRARWSTKD